MNVLGRFKFRGRRVTNGRFIAFNLSEIHNKDGRVFVDIGCLTENIKYQDKTNRDI